MRLPVAAFQALHPRCVAFVFHFHEYRIRRGDFGDGRLPTPVRTIQLLMDTTGFAYALDANARVQMVYLSERDGEEFAADNDLGLFDASHVHACSRIAVKTIDGTEHADIARAFHIPA